MTTPLDALVSAVRDAASYNAAAEAPPEAVLWCDENQEFLPLLLALRERLPELLTYGDFDAATRTGPAVWLRAALAGAVSGIEIPEGVTPILYLPGVGRETLKSADDSPALLQPLVWYTVAGTLFGHVNGKDWTLRGFLGSDRGPPESWHRGGQCDPRRPRARRLAFVQPPGRRPARKALGRGPA